MLDLLALLWFLVQVMLRLHVLLCNTYRGEVCHGSSVVLRIHGYSLIHVSNLHNPCQGQLTSLPIFDSILK